MVRRRKEEEQERRIAAQQRSWNLVMSYGAHNDEFEDRDTTSELIVDLTSPDIGPARNDSEKSQRATSDPGLSELDSTTADEIANQPDSDVSEPVSAPDVTEDSNKSDITAVEEATDAIHDVGRHATKPGPDTAGVSATLAGYQQDVVDWLGYAMSAWLEYFFVLGDGTPEERLDKAGDELARAARRLNQVAFLISDLRDSKDFVNKALRTYTTTVEMWANGVDMMSRGALLRRGRYAREGFRSFEEASLLLEAIVEIDETGATVVDLTGPLDTLSATEPSKRVSKKEVNAAKGPWRRALTGAGSPIRVLTGEPEYTKHVQGA